MAYRVTIPGAKEAEEGRSAGMGGSPTGEEVVIPVMVVTEKSHSPLLSLLPIPDLDAAALAEHFGLELPIGASADRANAALAAAMQSGRVDPKDVTDLHEAVVAAVREIQRGIQSGTLPPRRLVAGHPLAHWLCDLASLLREGARQP